MPNSQLYWPRRLTLSSWSTVTIFLGLRFQSDFPLSAFYELIHVLTWPRVSSAIYQLMETTNFYLECSREDGFYMDCPNTVEKVHCPVHHSDKKIVSFFFSKPSCNLWHGIRLTVNLHSRCMKWSAAVFPVSWLTTSASQNLKCLQEDFFKCAPVLPV